MSFPRSGPLKGILAQVRPQPARETRGPTPGSAQRRGSGFPQGANAEPCQPDRYSPYVDTATQDVALQLSKAGTRLAFLLNHMLAGAQAVGH
jgi:hypothetical protein